MELRSAASRVVLFPLLAVQAPQAHGQHESIPLCAHINGAPAIGVTDAVSILSWLFLVDGKLQCPNNISSCGDVNNDGRVNVTDAVYLLGWLFRGGPEPECPVANLNVAPQYIRVSTNAHNAPERAFDDDLETGSESSSMAHPHWLRIDLGRPTTVSRYEFHQLPTVGDWHSCGFQIEYSIDDERWHVAAEHSLPEGCPEYTFKGDSFRRQLTARYWRIVITSGEHWDRSELLELRLFGGDL